MATNQCAYIYNFCLDGVGRVFLAHWPVVNLKLISFGQNHSRKIAEAIIVQRD
jgi:hypothetical protein